MQATLVLFFWGVQKKFNGVQEIQLSYVIHEMSPEFYFSMPSLWRHIQWNLQDNIKLYYALSLSLAIYRRY